MSELEFNGGDDFPGMTKDQIYDLMSQMKSLIDQNEQQARHILIQNPKLTQVLFQAQIMLGMVRPNQPNPNIPPPASQQPQQAALPPQQTNVHAALPLPGQTDLKDHIKASQNPNSLRKPNQPMMPVSSTSIPSLNSQSHSLQSQILQSAQQPLNAQVTTMPVQQSTQFQSMPHPSLHSASPQLPSLPPPPMPSASIQSQQPLQTSGIPHMQPQPAMPSLPRPASIPAFGHQPNTQMGPNAAFQHSNTVQMHHSQPMFQSGQNHPASMGHSMLRGHEPPRQSLYQGGSPHLGMEFNQTGGPMQAERGSSWIPGLRENTTGTQNIPGPPSFMAGQMGPASQLPRPPALSSDMESALLQQVMSLTPEQISLLPPEQRNQVLQLQQMLRQSQ
ncbi:cleavage stimulating factor 64 [Heracleum sosnowskyi]|uniref:Cleavage stimulating factor 64 n=1 Tax=Heracleum sosnowskyi TaxID=360622 RepID=A0AAD8HTN4_9APIA|nr:cleavage stimulating factor 64 [Heracleum sosnowskyi]